MAPQREVLDTDGKRAERVHPTRHATKVNRHEVHCGVCGEVYYVDEPTYEHVKRTLEFDPSSDPFTCERCEEEYEAEEHGGH